MEKEYIKKPVLYIYVGLLGVLFFPALLVITLIHESGDFFNTTLPICLICVPICLVALLFLMMAALWRIEFDDDKVKFRNMFGITKTYYNHELTLKVGGNGMIVGRVYKGDKKITTISMLDRGLQFTAKFKNRV